MKTVYAVENLQRRWFIGEEHINNDCRGGVKNGGSVKNPYMTDFSHTNLCFAQIRRLWQRMEDYSDEYFGDELWKFLT